eukprot:TRINITY_DN38682_c0_g1_i1.p2 TRINITY_DN38682_c0_g1~~TRINITY_DN38682_c0_g1_i1.p2  ORF type:complete len:322 (-),score=80.49 TRINITY_DN38682_c0_g1_i1:869-1741(-)
MKTLTRILKASSAIVISVCNKVLVLHRPCHLIRTMDLGLGLLTGKRQAEAQGGAQAKTSKQDRDKDKKVNKEKGGDKLVQDIGRLALHASREVALVKGTITRVLIFDKTDGTKGQELFTQMKNISQAYTKTVAGLSQTERADYVSPHVFVWQDFLEWAKKEFGMEKQVGEYYKYMSLQVEAKLNHLVVTKQVDKTKEEEVTGVKQKLSRQEVAELTRIFKVAKCYDTTKGKIEFCAFDKPTKDLFSLIADQMKLHLNCKEKVGQAPKTELERRVERQVYSEASNARSSTS